MKILYVTTISLTMNSFFKEHISAFVKSGYKVDIACNFKELPLHKLYGELGCNEFQVDFSRSPLSLDNIKAYSQLKKIVESGKYDVVHCHTPNASIITRLVCRKLRKKNGLKVFYTAHGFHFYKGALLKNWLLYYPVEKFCSRFTDKLITINQEDYVLAQKKFKAKEVRYVPGVGIDLSRFQNVQADRDAKRREIGVPEDCFLLLSVGELNKNKNHQIVIKALAKLNDPNIHYAIAGVGDKKDCLLKLSEDLGVSRQIHMLGYRTDVAQLYRAADLFCFPSYREGLGLAAIEAMASALPIVTSNVHGINDYSINGVTGYKCSPNDSDELAKAISKVLTMTPYKLEAIKKYNIELACKYDYRNIVKLLFEVYGDNKCMIRDKEFI